MCQEFWSREGQAGLAPERGLHFCGVGLAGDGILVLHALCGDPLHFRWGRRPSRWPPSVFPAPLTCTKLNY